MHSASQIGGQQQNVRQFQIISLVPHPQIGLVYKEIWPAWLATTEQIFEHLKWLLLIIKHKFVLSHFVWSF